MAKPVPVVVVCVVALMSNPCTHMQPTRCHTNFHVLYVNTVHFYSLLSGRTAATIAPCGVWGICVCVIYKYH